MKNSTPGRYSESTEYSCAFKICGNVTFANIVNSHSQPLLSDVSLSNNCNNIVSRLCLRICLANICRTDNASHAGVFLIVVNFQEVQPNI